MAQSLPDAYSQVDFSVTASDNSIAGSNTVLAEAREVLTLEAQAILDISARLDEQFIKAVDLLYKCTGKAVVTGMGKSGHIGHKIAATLASTGTPAFFVHPAELRHGDFGMLEERDVVIALSGSGETSEIKLVLDPLKRLGLSIIAITGNTTSTLAQYSEIVLDVAVKREACPLNLAPTTSTTAALAMGDALAIALMKRKNFQAEDFAKAHPGGNLGKSLVTVQDIMRQGRELPVVALDADYPSIISEISNKKLGLTTVCDAAGTLCGVISDGDLRRGSIKFGTGVFSSTASDLMTVNPKRIADKALAAEALKLIDKYAVNDLIIVDESNKPVGVVHLRDMVAAGII